MRSFPTVLVAVLCAPPSLWAHTVVYPTGSYPADHQAVQAAVDGGGRVLLKAVNAAGEPTAFDFGPPVAGSGSVELTTDVDIRGEVVSGRRTTIRGGNVPFFGALPVRSAVKNIHFDGPRASAVFLTASSGAEISGNVIHDVVGFPWFENLRKATGVWILGLPAGGDGPVTGTVTISGNTIADMHAEDGIGLALVGFEARMRVIGNDIRGTNFIGILAFAHEGRTWIQDNNVIPGPEIFPGIYSAGNGIQVGPVFDGMFKDPVLPAFIHNNRVACANVNADGIVLFGSDEPLDRSVVTSNRVTMADALYGGITLYDNVSHTLVAANQVQGGGAYALDVVGGSYPGALNNGNVFIANQTAHFDETVADVFLDAVTEDTWVIGCQGTALDLGTNNHILGCSLPAAPEGARERPMREDPAHRRDPAAWLENERAAARELREELSIAPSGRER